MKIVAPGVVLGHNEPHHVPPLGFLAGVAEKALGVLVEEGDVAFRVHAYDDAVRELHQFAVLALALAKLVFHVVLVQRHFHHGKQLLVLEGLDDVAVGHGLPGLLEGGPVGVGGEENDGDVEPLPGEPGGQDAVHVSLDNDVHKNQVGFFNPGKIERVPARRGDPCDCVPVGLELFLDVHRGDGFVFGYQN